MPSCNTPPCTTPAYTWTADPPLICSMFINLASLPTVLGGCIGVGCAWSASGTVTITITTAGMGVISLTVQRDRVYSHALGQDDITDSSSASWTLGGESGSLSYAGQGDTLNVAWTDESEHIRATMRNPGGAIVDEEIRSGLTFEGVFGTPPAVSTEWTADITRVATGDWASTPNLTSGQFIVTQEASEGGDGFSVRGLYLDVCGEDICVE